GCKGQFVESRPSRPGAGAGPGDGQRATILGVPPINPQGWILVTSELRVRAERELPCQNGTRNMFWNMLSVTLCQFGHRARIIGLAASLPALLFFAVRASAAESAADSASLNPLRPGAVGIEFGVNSVFGGGFGGTLSGKWHMGRSTAIRLGGEVDFRE